MLTQRKRSKGDAALEVTTAPGFYVVVALCVQVCTLPCSCVGLHLPDSPDSEQVVSSPGAGGMPRLV